MDRRSAPHREGLVRIRLYHLRLLEMPLLEAFEAKSRCLVHLRITANFTLCYLFKYRSFHETDGMVIC